MNDWNKPNTFPEGGREIEFRWRGGRIERLHLMEYGQWSDSHWGDLLGAHRPGDITGWRYITTAGKTDG
jgi:hypothetical protein